MRVSCHQNQRVEGFLQRYVFQTVIYALWRERNGRMHGDDPNPPARLVGWLDKQIRNRLSAIRLMGDGRYASGLQKWFASKH